ncbi:MAG: leucyl aminopeptidase family protein [Phycisphaerales bacterium]|nr:leucyl aminopeptidase family protein [Phycisphaerales bacterium]
MESLGTTFEFGAGGRKGPEAIIVPLVTTPKPPLSTISAVDELCGGAVAELFAAGAAPTDAGSVAHVVRSGPIKRIVVISLGAAEKVDAKAVRSAATTAAQWIVDQKLSAARLWIDGLASLELDNAVGAWALGMMLAGFRYETYRKVDKPAPAKVRISVESANTAQATRAINLMKAEAPLAESVNYARGLAHRPANELNPQTLAAEARRLAKEDAKIKTTVLDAAQLKKLKMNGLLAVGQGATHKACLIRMEYRGAPKSKRVTAIIGKAITFDTGGYSIKQTSGMWDMKFDKCGGMTVFGVMRAVARLKLPVNVIGLVPSAENMISAEAYRPGDIIQMMNGKSVEIISADAEGRMILADTLTYAEQQCKPTEMIDLATLTGGVRIALGVYAAAVLGDNDDLCEELVECGRRTGERLWRLPVWDDYFDLIKGNDSDMRNSSLVRDAHCVVGGIFLKQFVTGSTPWAHLDIAGVATDDKKRQATGFGVRLLVDYLRRRKA